MNRYERSKADTANGAGDRERVWTRKRGLTLLFAVAVLGLIGIAGPAVAQEDSCGGSGTNGECNAFGSVFMDNRERVRGEPVDVDATITLNKSYEDQGARWILFSIRNITTQDESPVSIRLNTFSTDQGEVVTTRVDHEKPNELNLWVDVLDLPVNEPIELNVTVGVTEEGAYAIETLVLAFDRGYDPIKDASGENVGLFSYTLLGVNEATDPVDASGGDSPLGIRGAPGPTAAGAIGAIATVAAVCAGRRRR